MKPRRDKRLHALQALIRKASWDLESAKIEGHWARNASDAAEQALQEAQDKVAGAENSVRTALMADDTLSLSELSLQRAYLLQRRAICDQKQNERDRASQTLESVTEQLKRRLLSVRGLESAQDRRANLLRRTSDRRFWWAVDELWNSRKDTKS